MSAGSGSAGGKSQDKDKSKKKSVGSESKNVQSEAKKESLPSVEPHDGKSKIPVSSVLVGLYWLGRS